MMIPFTVSLVIFIISIFFGLIFIGVGASYVYDERSASGSTFVCVGFLLMLGSLVMFAATAQL